MDLPSLSWKIFRLDNSLQSESDPAELLARDSDEKETTAVVFGFQLIPRQQPPW